MNIKIPLSVPSIHGNEWRYIKECLDAGWVSSAGDYVVRFEEAVARYLDARYTVATVNGTAALHLALMACGARSGDEVIVPALTFIAPVNSIKYCGAEPVFMDCDPRTLCLDVEKMADFIKKMTVQKKDGYLYNKRTKKKIKAVIPVHIFGHPADMKTLASLCKKYNIDIVEDAAESLGSEYGRKKTGRWGKVGCLSFNGNKIITTGGGGMVVTDDESIARRIRHLSTQARSDKAEYWHDEVGYNYRLSNLQAAMGVAQMEKIEGYIEIKRNNASIYRRLLSGTGAEFIWESPDAKSNFWLYTIRVAGGLKRPLANFMLSSGIEARQVWRLMHTLPMYRKCQAYRIEASPLAYETCLNIPSSVDLEEKDIRTVVDTIGNFFERHAVCQSQKR